LDYITAIESNLYQFYEFIACKGGLELIHENHYSWIRNRYFSWPNWVFRPDRTKLLDEEFLIYLTGKIRTGEIPSFLVTMEPDDPAGFYLMAEKHGLRQIAEWKGMAMDQGNYHYAGQNNCPINICEVSTEALLTEWIGVVNSGLFNSKSLDIGLMRFLYLQEQMKLYLGTDSGLPVASALSFRKDHVTGLYMVAVRPDHRNRGYGTAITRYAAEHCFRHDAGHIILHSSRMAENIYKNIGFKDYCKFGILWMVGKEYYTK
jgi:GNAT superfamily N-acetyltransferase